MYQVEENHSLVIFGTIEYRTGFLLKQFDENQDVPGSSGEEVHLEALILNQQDSPHHASEQKRNGTQK